MYDVGCKLLGGIKSMYVDNLGGVRVKGGVNEWYRIDSGVRQGCIMSPWLFNAYINAVMKEVKIGMGRKGVRFMEDGREWRLPGLLYADVLVLCCQSEEDLRVMVGLFVEVCRKRGMKVNSGKSKVMAMNREEGLECEVHVDGVRLEDVSEFKYLGCVLDEADTDAAECSRKVASGRIVVGAIRSLVNVRDFQFECARALHEKLFVPVLTYHSATMLWRRRRDLVLGLYRWITTEARLVLGGQVISTLSHPPEK